MIRLILVVSCVCCATAAFAQTPPASALATEGATVIELGLAGRDGKAKPTSLATSKEVPFDPSLVDDSLAQPPVAVAPPQSPPSSDAQGSARLLRNDNQLRSDSNAARAKRQAENVNTSTTNHSGVQTQPYPAP